MTTKTDRYRLHFSTEKIILIIIISSFRDRHSESLISVDRGRFAEFSKHIDVKLSVSAYFLTDDFC